VLINDWSLRNLVAGELAKGFGFFQSKPATAFAPLAITPDELGEAWRDGLAAVRVKVDWNGTAFMQANAGEGTRFSFAELIAHAAKTRNLRPGTIVGSGTVSGGGAVGCIAELRAREVLEAQAAGEKGKARTEFMKFGDSVRIEAFDAHGHSVFGAIDQQVSSYRRRRAMAAQGAAAPAESAAMGEAALVVEAVAPTASPVVEVPAVIAATNQGAPVSASEAEAEFGESNPTPEQAPASAAAGPASEPVGEAVADEPVASEAPGATLEAEAMLAPEPVSPADAGGAVADGVGQADPLGVGAGEKTAEGTGDASGAAGAAGAGGGGESGTEPA
jgi:hypothetical protein